MPTIASRLGRQSIVGLAVAVAATLFVTPRPSAAGGQVSCTYTPGNARVRVEMTGFVGAKIGRDPFGAIYVTGTSSCDGATVQNTDSIYVIGDDGNQNANIDMRNGGLKPGLTNEPGTSDEIEIVLFLNAGTDSLTISGSDQAENIRFGRPASGFVVGNVNLNAGEATGVDADLILQAGTENVGVSAEGGADTVSGLGGAGTGQEFTLRMSLHGNNGGDKLTGGAAGDALWGDDGGDTLKGRGANDYLDTEDGISGNDTADGGGGRNDICITDAGDTQISC